MNELPTKYEDVQKIKFETNDGKMPVAALFLCYNGGSLLQSLSKDMPPRFSVKWTVEDHV